MVHTFICMMTVSADSDHVTQDGEIVCADTMEHLVYRASFWPLLLSLSLKKFDEQSCTLFKNSQPSF